MDNPLALLEETCNKIGQEMDQNKNLTKLYAESLFNPKSIGSPLNNIKKYDGNKEDFLHHCRKSKYSNKFSQNVRGFVHLSEKYLDKSVKDCDFIFPNINEDRINSCSFSNDSNMKKPKKLEIILPNINADNKYISKSFLHNNNVNLKHVTPDKTEPLKTSTSYASSVRRQKWLNSLKMKDLWSKLNDSPPKVITQNNSIEDNIFHGDELSCDSKDSNVKGYTNLFNQKNNKFISKDDKCKESTTKNFNPIFERESGMITPFPFTSNYNCGNLMTERLVMDYYMYYLNYTSMMLNTTKSRNVWKSNLTSSSKDLNNLNNKDFIDKMNEPLLPYSKVYDGNLISQLYNIKNKLTNFPAFNFNDNLNPLSKICITNASPSIMDKNVFDFNTKPPVKWKDFSSFSGSNMAGYENFKNSIPFYPRKALDLSKPHYFSSFSQTIHPKFDLNVHDTIPNKTTPHYLLDNNIPNISHNLSCLQKMISHRNALSGFCLSPSQIRQEQYYSFPNQMFYPYCNQYYGGAFHGINNMTYKNPFEFNKYNNNQLHPFFDYPKFGLGHSLLKPQHRTNDDVRRYSSSPIMKGESKININNFLNKIPSGDLKRYQSSESIDHNKRHKNDKSQC
ncbi:unnamed protein product [Gordionus sp. m RMFG-2023]